MKQGKRNGPSWFWWAVHNLIAHPGCEVLHWVRLGALGDWLHDETVPMIQTAEDDGLTQK